MTNGGAAAAIQAIKAAGAVVRIEPRDFVRLVERQDAALVVHAEPWLFRPGHRYLCGYKGLCFYAKSPTPLSFPGSTELVHARSFWIPI